MDSGSGVRGGSLGRAARSEFIEDGVGTGTSHCALRLVTTELSLTNSRILPLISFGPLEEFHWEEKIVGRDPGRGGTYVWESELENSEVGSWARRCRDFGARQGDGGVRAFMWQNRWARILPRDHFDRLTCAWCVGGNWIELKTIGRARVKNRIVGGSSQLGSSRCWRFNMHAICHARLHNPTWSPTP